MLNELYTAIKGTPHVVKVVNVVREITKGEKIENTAITQQVLLQRQKFYNFGEETLHQDDLDFEPFSMELELFLEEYETLTEANEKKSKMKTGIKMRVTPEQSKKVQEVVFVNGGWGWEWETQNVSHENEPFIFIIDGGGLQYAYIEDENLFLNESLEEVDPELFIRTNGTCEEDRLCGAEELKTIKHVLQDMEAPLKDFDPINPTHYQIGGIETINYLEAKLTLEEFKGYCKGNSIKYLSRAGYKDEERDDYKKTAWYLDRLLEIAQKQKDVTMEQSIKDYCSDREICCQNCRHIKDIMAGNGIPVFSCDCMYAAGAYNGSYVKQDIKTFACIEFEKKESSNG